MSELNKDYKCNICGNVVKVIQAGAGVLSCCGQSMELVVETAPMATSEITAAPEVKTEAMPSVSEPVIEENKPEPVL
jgi:desulfoferrodoxin-like iron-binding protein